MLELTSALRRELRARAHALEPVVLLGTGGLTPAVLQEVEVHLKAHELIKIKASQSGREERNAVLGEICEALGAAPVQHIGKTLVVYRPRPEEPAQAPAARGRGLRAGSKAVGKPAAVRTGALRGKPRSSPAAGARTAGKPSPSPRRRPRGGP